MQAAKKMHFEFAGVAQVERRRSLSEVAGSIPAPRSTITAAIADGIRGVDAQAWQEAWDAGRRDGAAGLSWNPYHLDMLGYASGYHHGEKFG